MGKPADRSFAQEPVINPFSTASSFMNKNTQSHAKIVQPQFQQTGFSTPRQAQPFKNNYLNNVSEPRANFEYENRAWNGAPESAKRRDNVFYQSANNVSPPFVNGAQPNALEYLYNPAVNAPFTGSRVVEKVSGLSKKPKRLGLKLSN